MVKGKDFLGSYHPSVTPPPEGSPLFNIELTKEDLTAINRLRYLLDLEGKTNHGIISYLLDATLKIEEDKLDQYDD
jgi:hypothetical protein